MGSFEVLLPITVILLKHSYVNGVQNNTPYKTDAAAIIYFSVPTKELSEKISHALISEKLAACVNVLPDITAVFPTNKNEIKAELQTMLIAKSATSRIQEVVEFIKKHHPDSMPDIVATPIKTGNGLFLEWVLSVVPPKASKKYLVKNSTKATRRRTTTVKPIIPLKQNVDEAANNEQDNEEQNQNYDDEPPTEEPEEKDVIYESENQNDGNDPNESHANDYP